MSKESIVILVNGVLAAVVLGLVGFGRIPLEVGIPILVALAVPSAAPELVGKLRELAANRRPPKGPSVMGLLLVVGAAHVLALAITACMPAAREPQLPAYCYDEMRFTAELAKCVDRASSRPESRACRAEVHRSCGITETVSALAVTS